MAPSPKAGAQQDASCPRKAPRRLSGDLGYEVEVLVEVYDGEPAHSAVAGLIGAQTCRSSRGAGRPSHARRTPLTVGMAATNHHETRRQRDPRHTPKQAIFLICPTANPRERRLPLQAQPLPSTGEIVPMHSRHARRHDAQPHRPNT